MSTEQVIVGGATSVIRRSYTGFDTMARVLADRLMQPGGGLECPARTVLEVDEILIELGSVRDGSA